MRTCIGCSLSILLLIVCFGCMHAPDVVSASGTSPSQGFQLSLPYDTEDELLVFSERELRAMLGDRLREYVDDDPEHWPKNALSDRLLCTLLVRAWDFKIRQRLPGVYGVLVQYKDFLHRGFVYEAVWSSGACAQTTSDYDRLDRGVMCYRQDGFPLGTAPEHLSQSEAMSVLTMAEALPEESVRTVILELVASRCRTTETYLRIVEIARKLESSTMRWQVYDFMVTRQEHILKSGESFDFSKFQDAILEDVKERGIGFVRYKVMTLLYGHMLCQWPIDKTLIRNLYAEGSDRDRYFIRDCLLGDAGPLPDDAAFLKWLDSIGLPNASEDKEEGEVEAGGD